MRAGTLNPQELPARPKSSTPEQLEQEYKIHRDEILLKLKPLLDENEKKGPFCTHPDAVIKFHILPENYHKINKRQYPIPFVLHEHLALALLKWEH